MGLEMEQNGQAKVEEIFSGRRTFAVRTAAAIIFVSCVPRGQHHHGVAPVIGTVGSAEAPTAAHPPVAHVPHKLCPELL
jgi:hypothetical protein